MRQQLINGSIKKITKYMNYAVMFILGFLAMYLLVRFVMMRTIVEGSSMYPTLTNGDHIIVDKLSYKLRKPERYDIIVFEEDISSSGYFIKRIIGLPGDKIYIDSIGKIYVNGYKIDDNYGYGYILNRGIVTEEITVGKNEYFVLGDNRNNSEDSRFLAVGNVAENKIFGKAILRTAPLKKFGYMDLYRMRTNSKKGDKKK